MYLLLYIFIKLFLNILLLTYTIDTHQFSSYYGTVCHHRLKTDNKDRFKFNYKIEMDYFNLKNPPISKLVYYDRKYYIGDKSQDLYDTIFNIIKNDEKDSFQEFDNIYTLTNIKSYGFCFNPINIHFCYNQEKLIYLLCEITNIPWFEKTYYILKIDDNQKIISEYKIHDKKMKVSPFNQISTQKYVFDLILDKNRINFKIELLNKIDNKIIITTNLNLEKKDFRFFRLPRNHLTVFRIYYKALGLYIKKFKYFKYERN